MEPQKYDYEYPNIKVVSPNLLFNILGMARSVAGILFRSTVSIKPTLEMWPVCYRMEGRVAARIWAATRLSGTSKSKSTSQPNLGSRPTVSPCTRVLPQSDAEEVHAADERECGQCGSRRHHPRRQRRLGCASLEFPEDGEGDAQGREGRRAEHGGGRGTAHIALLLNVYNQMTKSLI